MKKIPRIKLSLHRVERAMMEKRIRRQVDLAERMGVSSRKVNEWMNGKRFIPKSHLDKMAQVLGVDKTMLLSEKSDLPRLSNEVVTPEVLELLSAAYAISQLMYTLKSRNAGKTEVEVKLSTLSGVASTLGIASHALRHQISVAQAQHMTDATTEKFQTLLETI